MKSNSRWRRGLAVATVVSALGAPAASAAPVPNTTNGESGGAVDYSKNSATGDYAPATEAPVRVVQAGADNGFDWGDAGIGAGGLLALAAIGSGAVVAIRHRPDPRHRVA
jgi:hypothetical protein